MKFVLALVASGTAAAMAKAYGNGRLLEAARAAASGTAVAREMAAVGSMGSQQPRGRRRMGIWFLCSGREEAAWGIRFIV